MYSTTRALQHIQGRNPPRPRSNLRLKGAGKLLRDKLTINFSNRNRYDFGSVDLGIWRKSPILALQDLERDGPSGGPAPEAERFSFMPRSKPRYSTDPSRFRSRRARLRRHPRRARSPLQRRPSAPFAQAHRRPARRDGRSAWPRVTRPEERARSPSRRAPA